MEASIVDLRYHMNDVLKALARNESVTIMYHGEKKGVIVPCQANNPVRKVEETRLFGLCSGDQKDVTEVMKSLRGGRYNDI